MWFPVMPGRYLSRAGLIVDAPGGNMARIKGLVLPDGQPENVWDWMRFVLRGPDGPYVGYWPSRDGVLAILHPDGRLAQMVTVDPGGQLAVMALLAEGR